MQSVALHESLLINNSAIQSTQQGSAFKNVTSLSTIRYLLNTTQILGLVGTLPLAFIRFKAISKSWFTGPNTYLIPRRTRRNTVPETIAVSVTLVLAVVIVRRNGLAAWREVHSALGVTLLPGAAHAGAVLLARSGALSGAAAAAAGYVVDALVCKEPGVVSGGEVAVRGEAWGAGLGEGCACAEQGGGDGGCCKTHLWFPGLRYWGRMLLFGLWGVL
ncbi:hypothetical protein BDP67DRAFT_291012 [Colletotrichum lupini]|nr:hypothetical protein BDP67DRAFT_291012 [Colletotrichum lupini]